MLIAAVPAAALLGILIGSVLLTVARQGPLAISPRPGRRTVQDQVAILWSDVSVRPWRRQGRIFLKFIAAQRSPSINLLTGFLFAVVTWRFGVTWALPAYLCLAAVGVLLSVIDVQHQRLPNVIVAPFAVVSTLLLTLSTIGSGAWDSLARAAIGAVALFSFYLVLALISPASLGMGDVKLAGVLGLLMSYLSWRTFVYGATGAFVISALIGIAILVTRRGNRRTQVPFGPSMLLAAFLAVVVQGS